MNERLPKKVLKSRALKIVCVSAVILLLASGLTGFVRSVKADDPERTADSNTQELENSNVVYSTEFENGGTGWSTSGLWHITSEGDQYGDSHSGSKSMWYGEDSTGNYATGSQTGGSLGSPSIDLSGVSDAELTFQHWFETESYSGDYDQVKVNVNGQQVYYRDCSDPNVGSENNFVEEEIDISSFAGQEIEIDFIFDSLDKYSNDHRGWYVDDVSVQTDSNDGGNNPSASFTYSPSSPEVGETIQFTDESSDSDGNIVSCSWEFGDGSTSSEQDPSHTYGSAGTYTVSLEVEDNDGSTDTYSKDLSISQDQGDMNTVFSDNFEEGPLGWGTGGLWHLTSESDQYGDSSSGSNSMWYGQDSSGDYDTGSRTSGSLASSSIDLNGATQAELSFEHWFETENYDGEYDQITVLVNGDQVYYRDTSDPNVGSENNFVKETIDISDHAGQTIDLEFKFDSMDGSYNDYRGWYIDDVMIKADMDESETNSPPSASFGFTPSNPTTEDTVQFQDDSYDDDGNIASYSWEFGDGATSSEQSPSHTYGSPGTYDVTLTVQDDEGASDSYSTTVTINEADDGMESLLSEDFEGGASSWTSSGLWHLTSESDQYGDSKSGSKSMWYGQAGSGDYNTGERTNGALTSPSVYVPPSSEAQLTFQHWFKTESYDGEYDQVKVIINGEEVYYKDTSDPNVGSENDFVKKTIDISEYAGQQLQVKFVFDSVDGNANDYRGWYVDDVSIEADEGSSSLYVARAFQKDHIKKGYNCSVYLQVRNTANNGVDNVDVSYSVSPWDVQVISDNPVTTHQVGTNHGMAEIWLDLSEISDEELSVSVDSLSIDGNQVEYETTSEPFTFELKEQKKNTKLGIYGQVGGEYGLHGEANVFGMLSLDNLGNPSLFGEAWAGIGIEPGYKAQIGSAEASLQSSLVGGLLFGGYMGFQDLTEEEKDLVATYISTKLALYGMHVSGPPLSMLSDAAIGLLESSLYPDVDDTDPVGNIHAGVYGEASGSATLDPQIGLSGNHDGEDYDSGADFSLFNAALNGMFRGKAYVNFNFDGSVTLATKARFSGSFASECAFLGGSSFEGKGEITLKSRFSDLETMTDFILSGGDDPQCFPEMVNLELSVDGSGTLTPIVNGYFNLLSPLQQVSSTSESGYKITFNLPVSQYEERWEDIFADNTEEGQVDMNLIKGIAEGVAEGKLPIYYSVKSQKMQSTGFNIDLGATVFGIQLAMSGMRFQTYDSSGGVYYGGEFMESYECSEPTSYPDVMDYFLSHFDASIIWDAILDNFGLSINCPVNVTVEDSYGNTISLGGDGVDNEISDSSAVYGEHKSFKLPHDERNYTVTVTGQEDGTFSMDLGDFNESGADFVNMTGFETEQGETTTINIYSNMTVSVQSSTDQTYNMGAKHVKPKGKESKVLVSEIGYNRGSIHTLSSKSWSSLRNDRNPKVTMKLDQDKDGSNEVLTTLKDGMTCKDLRNSGDSRSIDEKEEDESPVGFVSVIGIIGSLLIVTISGVFGAIILRDDDEEEFADARSRRGTRTELDSKNEGRDHPVKTKGRSSLLG